jgi:hypothetical protein
MHFTALDYTFEAVGFIGHSMLLYILRFQRITRQFPLFTAFVVFQLVRTAIFIPIQLAGARSAYYYVYYVLNIFDVFFTAGVIYGIAHSVFRPLGYWAPDVRSRGMVLFSLAIAVAVGVTAQIQPPVALLIQKTVFRANFFVALLMVELFAIIMAESSRAGLAWRHHVRCIADAFAVYSIVFLAAEWGHSHYGVNSFIYQQFAHARIAAYWLALVYWIVMLWWLPQPERPASSADAMKAMFDRHHKLEDQTREAGRG